MDKAELADFLRKIAEGIERDPQKNVVVFEFRVEARPYIPPEGVEEKDSDPTFLVDAAIRWVP
jgi:hypothetical protein